MILYRDRLLAVRLTLLDFITTLYNTTSPVYYFIPPFQALAPFTFLHCVWTPHYHRLPANHPSRIIIMAGSNDVSAKGKSSMDTNMDEVIKT